MQEGVNQPPVKTKRKRWRHGALGAFLALVILLFLALGAGQIVLSTDLPRNLIVKAVEKSLALKMSARDVRAGWLGSTDMYDVTFTLPLADKAFLSVPHLRVQHSNLPSVIAGGSLDIHEIQIDQPTLTVFQDRRGTWNFEEIAQLITRAAGGNKDSNANNKSDNSPPQLPTLHVKDATVIVVDNRNRSTSIKSISLDGQPDSPLVWNYQALAPGQMEITGKVASGGKWRHEVSISLHHAASWFSPWVASWPDSAQLSAKWSGQIEDNGLNGRLQIEKASYGPATATGPVDLTINDSTATLRPRGLSFSYAILGGLELRFDDGQIVLAGADLLPQQLLFEIGGGRASLDGKLALTDGTASLNATWRDVGIPVGLTHSGELSIENTPTLGYSRFKATLGTRGSNKFGSWDSKLLLQGGGKDSHSLQITLSAPTLRLVSNANHLLDLSGLSARLSSAADGFLLTSLNVQGSSPITGEGGYVRSQKLGWLSIQGRNWRFPGAPAVNVNFNAWADTDHLHLDQLYVQLSGLSVYALGDYVYHRPKPVEVQVYLTEDPLAQNDQTALVKGLLRGDLDVEGTLLPVNLTLGGEAIGQNVWLKSKRIGDLAMVLNGSVTDGRVDLSSRQFELFGGHWDVEGHWPVENSILRLDQLKFIGVSLPLALGRSDITGTADGDFSVDLRELDLAGIEVNGKARLSNVTVNHGNRQVFAVDEANIAHVGISNSTILLNPVQLSRKEGDQSGAATLSAETTLDRPSQWSVKFDAHTWPLHQGQATASLSASGKTDIDLANLSAVGHVDLSVAAVATTRPLGQVDAAIDLDQRVIQANSIHISALGGNAQGRAKVDIDHPMESTGRLDWKSLDISQLRGLISGLEQFSGTVDGSVEMAKSTDPRPLEPMGIDLNIQSHDVRVGHVQIGDARIFAYAGERRLVLGASPERSSVVNLAGGQVLIWGRVNRHQGGDYDSLVELNLQNVDVSKLLPPGQKSKRTPGLLNGQIAVVGNPHDLKHLTGQAHFQIIRSDLANTFVISFLYNSLRLGHDPSKPVGEGQSGLALHDNQVDFSEFLYFYPGSEVRITGSTYQIERLGDSPISWTAVGSARPFKSIDIPGLSDIDTALSLLQRGIVSVRVNGTLAHPNTPLPIPFAQLGRQVLDLLFGGNSQSDSSSSDNSPD